MPNDAFTKRQKERARADRARDKRSAKEEKKRSKADRPAGAPGEDPDIAGIVPGPQPVAEEFREGEEDS